MKRKRRRARRRWSRRKRRRVLLLVGLLVLVIGFVLPETMRIPVRGATAADWNHDTFWYHPWGTSGVHKGIDIFADRGTDVIAATGGWVMSADEIAKGGKIVLVLGPKWKLHYYAHLDRLDVRSGQWVRGGQTLGAVGTTGNAAGRPPHLHYAIRRAVPHPWEITTEPQGWQRMFYANPHEALIGLPGAGVTADAGGVDDGA